MNKLVLLLALGLVGPAYAAKKKKCVDVLQSYYDEMGRSGMEFVAKNTVDGGSAFLVSFMSKDGSVINTFVIAKRKGEYQPVPGAKVVDKGICWVKGKKWYYGQAALFRSDRAGK